MHIYERWFLQFVDSVDVCEYVHIMWCVHTSVCNNIYLLKNALVCFAVHIALSSSFNSTKLSVLWMDTNSSELAGLQIQLLFFNIMLKMFSDWREKKEKNEPKQNTVSTFTSNLLATKYMTLNPYFWYRASHPSAICHAKEKYESHPQLHSLENL